MTALQFEESSNVIVLEKGESGYDTNPTTISTTLQAATTLAITVAPAGEDITAITIEAGKNDFKDADTALKVLVGDTAGNKVDIGHMILHTDTNPLVKEERLVQPASLLMIWPMQLLQIIYS